MLHYYGLRGRLGLIGQRSIRHQEALPVASHTVSNAAVHSDTIRLQACCPEA